MENNQVFEIGFKTEPWQSSIKMLLIICIDLLQATAFSLTVMVTLHLIARVLVEVYILLWMH